MPERRLTGSRIRARRLDLGLAQAALARTLGVSASYLNLIEHNRRPVAGRLLGAIARALDCDPAYLSDGVDAAVLDGLRDAAARFAATPVPTTGADFAARFPHWAALIAAQSGRIDKLQNAIEALNDRMTHDPRLSASLHEMLSAVTAIRSTSAILADGAQVDPEWQRRFHRNLLEDSRRLSDSAKLLVGYLEGTAPGNDAGLTPQEELENWLGARAFHLAEIEAGQGTPALPDDLSAPGRALIAAHVAQYRVDAQAVPLAPLRAALRGSDDPGRLAVRFHTDIHTLFRRIASLPEGWGDRPVGLVTCDASGTLGFRKPLDGFPVPRFGGACPLWPLFAALARPMEPLRRVVEQPGRLPLRFMTFAQAVVRHPGGFEAPGVTTAAMLIVPHDGAEDGALPIGPGCRICPRTACVARREPSVLDPAP